MGTRDNSLQPLRRALRLLWRGLREWCGDAAYESYLQSRARQASTEEQLSAEEFYVERVNRHYSRPHRCC
jgi:uncharacterized short protein YbdD (DUF466 family)